MALTAAERQAASRARRRLRLIPQRDEPLEVGQPFTIAHFKAWATRLELDNGQPWVIEPFQEAFIADVFSGVPEIWLIVPEGNAKTTLIAGLALYHIRYRQSGRVLVAASARDQAEWVYSQGEGFVNRSELDGYTCLEGYRRIRFDAMDARIQIFASDDRTGDGAIPTLAILDELHRHRDLRLYRTWRGKLEKRGAQIVAISTRGEPGSEFELALERIRREATDIDRQETFLRAASKRMVLHEWAVPEDGDVEDFELVKRANPLRAITIEGLREKFASPTMTLPHWKRFVCNLPTRSDNAAITEAEWAAARTTEAIPAGEPIWLGLDVAFKWDTTAAVPFWMPSREKRIFGPAEILVPPRDGSSLNPDLVEQTLRRIHARNPIHTVVMDTSQAMQLAHWIADEFGATVIDRQQTNPLAVQDFNDFMEGLRLGLLKHSGDPGLTQHALNAIARMLPLGDSRFDRPIQSRLGQEQNRRVIDALTAASMVHSTALRVPPPAHEANFAWA